MGQNCVYFALNSFHYCWFFFFQSCTSIFLVMRESMDVYVRTIHMRPICLHGRCAGNLRQTPSHRRSLGLATPPPAAIPGWPFSNVPQRRRVFGHCVNCVNCVHAPRTPPHGLVLPLPQPCMLPRLSQSRKHARIDFCMVSAADKLRANDDVRSHDAGLTTRSPTGTADNPEHDQPKLEPK